MRDRQPRVYILASKTYGTLYVGVTSNLAPRMHQHRSGSMKGFAARYHIYKLVRFELLPDMITAIAREKQLKNWHRDWKINLIQDGNPDWIDLATSMFGLPPIDNVRRQMDPETSSG